jgi:hypothetical protein
MVLLLIVINFGAVRILEVKIKSLYMTKKCKGEKSRSLLVEIKFMKK